jgi:WD40 repeat protein
VFSIIIGSVNTTEGQDNPLVRVFETDPVGQMRLSPDGEFLALVEKRTDDSDNDTVISIWNITTEKVIRSFDTQYDVLKTIEWSPDGSMLASLDRNYNVQVWDVVTGDRLYNIKLDEVFDDREEYLFALTSLAWSPDGTRIAIGNDYELTVWRFATDEVVNVPRDTSVFAIVMGVAWSPDGDQIARAGDGGSILVYDVMTFEELVEFPVVSRHPTIFGSQYLSWQPNGTLLATFSNDPLSSSTPEIHIRDVSAEYLTTLGGHTEPIRAVHWSPDGSMLASVGEDMIVYVWDVETSEVLQTFEGHSDVITSVDWFPESDKLVTSSWDGTIRFWSINRK